MKKILFSISLLFFGLAVFAQSGFNWQGVLRDDNNNVIANQDVSVRITIMKDGSMAMRETHNLTTTSLGLMTLEVCNGTNVSGDCASIDWSNGSFMLNVAVDPDGGSNYNDFGSSQILMVPTAAYATVAGSAMNDQVDDADNDPQNEIQTLMFDNQRRELSISGVSGFIRIPSTGQDADFDPTNELQQLTKNPQGQIVLSHNNGLVVDGVVDDAVDDADADPMNELQSLTLNGTDLSISDRNTISLAGLGGGGPSIWTQQNQNIFYDPPTPGARIEYGPGTFDVGLGGSQARNITARSNRLKDELSFRTPNSSDEHAIGHYIQDFPSPDYNEIYSRIEGDTCFRLIARNFTNGNTADLRMLGLAQGINYVGLQGVVNTGGWGTFYNTVGGVPGAWMGAAGADPFSGVVSLNGGNVQLEGGVVLQNGQAIVFGDVKNFKMAHPDDDSKEIWYASIEGPEAAAYERGTATLVNGEAFIPFTEHFELVVNPLTMTVNLTPNSAESLGLAVIEKTASGIRVKELFKGTGNYSFDWEVKAVRKGYEDYKVVRDKLELDTQGVPIHDYRD